MKVITKRLPWIILIAGACITAWGTWSVAKQIESEARSTFESQVHSFETTVIRRLRSYEDILFGVAGLYRTLPEVSTAQFEEYASSLDVKQRFPALSVINFAQYVPAKSRAAFLREFAATKDRQSNAVVPALPDHYPEYMVITRVFPRMQPGIGVELFRNARRIGSAGSLKAGVTSIDSYSPNVVVSSAVPFIPPGWNVPALAARLGIFKKTQGAEDTFIGTAGIGFDLKKFFEEAVPTPLAHMLQYKIVNVGRSNATRYDNPILVFSNIDEHAWNTTEDTFSTTLQFDFGGAALLAEVREVRDNLISPRDRMLPATVAIVGILLFGMLSMLSRRLLRDNSVLSQAVADRTSELRLELEHIQKLEREVAHIAEEERRRIGRELHDDIGQRLTGLSLATAALAKEIAKAAPLLAERARLLGRATSEAISQVRGLAHGLLPVAAGPAGLRAALENLAADVSALGNVHCSFDFNDPVDIADDDIAAHLYRILQEAISNAIRHGAATRIDVRLDYIDGKVALSIKDNGIGLNENLTADEGKGAGLRLMNYRASVINFKLTMRSVPGVGTTIEVTEC